MKFKLLFLFIFISAYSVSQNTLGILRNDSASYNGYTLFAPYSSTETYLINNCGEVVNQWTSSFTPAASVYLLENGNLLRTGKISNPVINFPGVGGKIELFDWDNNLLWEYSYSSNSHAQHHDIYPLPNGNVLMLAVDTMTEAEAIQAGRNPVYLIDDKLYNEQILELQPVGTNQANVVWEWNFRDHLVQDFDNTKDNYGVIGDHPELLDINYLDGNSGGANWLHINSIQYNAELDQIVLSSRLLSEIYIIDHSTSTSEAASHSGGTYGKGGDILYRWGNPEAYDKGNLDNRTLFGQHHPHWIPNGLVDGGKIMIFNNGNSIGHSSIDIISPPQSSPGFYNYNSTTGYEPATAEWSYTSSPDPSNFFSSIQSSGQRLPNGNTLICDSDSGYIFEIDPSNTIVWEYINPDSALGILSQGDDPSQNLMFRARRFPIDFVAFQGRDLTPGNPIENNPDLSGCSILSVADSSDTRFKLFPNPVATTFSVSSQKPVSSIKVIDLFGNLVTASTDSKSIDISQISDGFYLVQIEIEGQLFVKKIIKKN